MTISPTQGEHAQTEALRPKFGDLLRNTMASESNPRRDAYFIREVHRSGGGVNPGRWFEMTDGKGETWLSNPQTMVSAAPAQPAAPQGVAYAELPKITAEDRSFLHDNPNTDDIVKWVRDYARACIDADRASNGQAPAGAGMGHTDGGRNMFYEGRFDGETQREQQARLRWANDMRAAFERHTGNGWFDKDWRAETGLWSAAWHACLAAQPTSTAQAAPSEGDWIDADDVDTLARQLDVALNGEAGAAKQASLCDVVAQVEQASRKLGRPLLAAPAAERENLELRRMLCIAHAGAAAYMDDGEAQDNRELPLIDFLHDTPAEIQDKLQRRALKKLAAQAAAPTPAAQADSVLEDAALLHYALADGGNQSMNWQDVYDDWNGEGYFIDALRAAYKQDAARKQGAKHD